MARARCLDMPAIAASLKAVQQNFDEINKSLSTPRDAITDEVRGNMIAGYAMVDCLLAAKTDLFAAGNSELLLELNCLVLCGEDEAKRKDFAQHIARTEERFYDRQGGDVGGFMEWLQHHKSDDVWRRSAGAYIHILSQPQLFIEGNHRTGSLLMSYILARDGRPPFVLSVENAKAYFDPSTLVKQSKRKGLDLLTKLPKLSKRFALLLKNNAETKYLTASV